MRKRLKITSTVFGFDSKPFFRGGGWIDLVWWCKGSFLSFYGIRIKRWIYWIEKAKYALFSSYKYYWNKFSFSILYKLPWSRGYCFDQTNRIPLSFLHFCSQIKQEHLKRSIASSHLYTWSRKKPLSRHKWATSGRILSIYCLNIMPSYWPRALLSKWRPMWPGQQLAWHKNPIQDASVD